MTNPLFIQIHTLVSYPASLLNRDDVGFAKRLPFGGASRTRVSSQCLKRHWRVYEGDFGFSTLHGPDDGIQLSVRSRESFLQYVYKPLLEQGVEQSLATAATEAVMAQVLGKSKKAKNAEKTKKNEAGQDIDGTKLLKTEQITVLGKPELDFFLQEAKRLADAAGEPKKIAVAEKEIFTKEWKKNLDGLKHAAGLDAALFGRMVTSDSLSRCDAAIHVAHAFTVHGELTETDYFTVVDDLLQGGDDPQLGSGHIGTSELTSGLFYVYAVVDVAQLVSNLAGCPAKNWADSGIDRTLASKVVEQLIHVIVRVSPGAKKGSTAPYAYANMLLVEAGSAQPRTLANAFLKPVKPRPDLLVNAYQALGQYVVEIDEMYGWQGKRELAATGPREPLERIASPVPVANVAQFAARQVLEPNG